MILAPVVLHYCKTEASAIATSESEQPA
jgi:hypothetical protein